MKIRITGMMLAAVMLIGMMSFFALAAGETNAAGQEKNSLADEDAYTNDSQKEDADQYPVWVAGTQVDESNRGDILRDGGSVSFFPATETDPARLTLSGATIAAGEADCGLTAISSHLDHLTIELIGTNIIGRAADWTLADPDSLDYAVLRGIDAVCRDDAENETIYGSLTFTGESGSSLTIYDYEAGITAGNITFTEDFRGTLTINNYGDNGIGAISAVGLGYYDDADEFVYTGEGKVTLLGGTYVIQSECIDGINADGDIAIDGVTLTIHAGDEGIDSYRGNVAITGCPIIDILSDDESIEAYKAVSIVNCPNAKTVSQNDDAIYAGDIVITNSSVNVTACNDYDGLDADTDEDGAGSVTINGGSRVDIHSTDSGIECYSLSISGKGTEVYSVGGAGIDGDSCGAMVQGGESNIAITDAEVRFTGDRAAVILISYADTDADPFTHSLPNVTFAGSAVFDTFESMQEVTYRSEKVEDSEGEFIYEEYAYVGDQVAKSVTIEAPASSGGTQNESAGAEK